MHVGVAAPAARAGPAPRAARATARAVSAPGVDERDALAHDLADDVLEQRIVRAAEDQRVELVRARAAPGTRARPGASRRGRSSPPRRAARTAGRRARRPRAPGASARSAGRTRRSAPCSRSRSRRRLPRPAVRSRRRRARPGSITPTTGTPTARRPSSGSASALAVLHATTIAFTSRSSRKRDDLAREARHRLLRLVAVGQARDVAEVDELLVGQDAQQLAHDGEPADPRVEDAERARVAHRHSDTSSGASSRRCPPSVTIGWPPAVSVTRVHVGHVGRERAQERGDEQRLGGRAAAEAAAAARSRSRGTARRSGSR